MRKRLSLSSDPKEKYDIDDDDYIDSKDPNDAIRLRDGRRRANREEHGPRRSTMKSVMFDVFRALTLVRRRLRAVNARIERDPSKRRSRVRLSLILSVHRSLNMLRIKQTPRRSLRVPRSPRSSYEWKNCFPRWRCKRLRGIAYAAFSRCDTSRLIIVYIFKRRAVDHFFTRSRHVGTFK